MTSSRGFISLRYKICPKHKVCLLKEFLSSSLRCILTGPLGIKTALPDYKNCIWVTSRLVESIGYQDGPFELRTTFEVTRDCRTLDFPWVLRSESRLRFKSFYKFHFIQNHILPSYILFPIILHELWKHSLILCIFLQSPQTQHELFRSLDHLFEGLGT